MWVATMYIIEVFHFGPFTFSILYMIFLICIFSYSAVPLPFIVNAQEEKETYINTHISHYSKWQINNAYLPVPDNLRTSVRVRLVLGVSLPVINVNFLHATKHQLGSTETVGALSHKHAQQCLICCVTYTFNLWGMLLSLRCSGKYCMCSVEIFVLSSRKRIFKIDSELIKAGSFLKTHCG